MSTIQQYKGFTIRTVYEPDQRFIVDGVQFNHVGYATINNAKGAITKHIAKHDKGMEQLAALWKQDDAQSHQKSLQATNDSKEYASMDIETERAVEAVKGLAEANYAELEMSVIASGATLFKVYGPDSKEFLVAKAKVLARMKPKTVQSRNKREGRYNGKVNRKDYRVTGWYKCGNALGSLSLEPHNRKQRKLAEIRAKHYKEGYRSAEELFKALGV